MNRFFKKVKNDNKGMTLLLAIVAVAFVGILAASIVSATTTNYKLKMMDRYSKETFYSADSVVEEIHTGIGIKCFDALSEAYNYAARNLLYQGTLGGGVSLTQKTNAEANEAMKLRYKTLMCKNICGETMVLSNREEVLKFLNSFISNTNNARVISYKDVLDDATNYGYTIEDVTIEYKRNDNVPYYSTVAVDIDIKYPDIDIDFISDRKELKSYLDYCLIAMDDITVGYSETLRGNAVIAGGAYAGTDGLSINPGSRFQLNDHIKVGSQTKVPTRLVTSGDVKLLGGNNNAVFQVGAADVWCNNITVGKDTSPGTVLYTSTDARTFVADDLSLEGTGCNVTVKGTYLGFGSNNANTANPNKKYSSTSSAIIVNGRNCTLDLTGIKTLLLAGKAYVDLGDTQEYLTGDSLALKGNQEIYIVPMAYLTKANDTVDPLNVSNPTLVPDAVEIKLDDFFATKLGLLSDRRYVARESDGKTYFYLDFKNDDAQNIYVRCILEDQYLSNLLTQKGLFETRHITERNSIYSTVEMGISRFFDKNTAITLASNARIFSTGMLAEVTPGTTGLPKVNLHNANSIQPDDVIGMSTSTANKYKIINAYLDIEEDAVYVPFPSQIVIDGGTYDVQENKLPNIYDLIIDTASLEELTNNIINRDGTTIAAVITSKDSTTSSVYKIPADARYGVVLGYGVDIELTHNFEGLIITNGKITIAGEAKITTGDNNRAELTLDVYNDVAKYFYMFKETSETKQIEELDIDDVLELSNWRKNENV